MRVIPAGLFFAGARSSRMNRQGTKDAKTEGENAGGRKTTCTGMGGEFAGGDACATC